MRKRILTAMALGMCLSLAACGRSASVPESASVDAGGSADASTGESASEDAEGSETTAASADKTEGSGIDQLTVAISQDDIENINVHLYIGSTIAQGMVFEGLTTNTPEGNGPGLATSWDISPDGKTYTFHLRKGVKFTDGEPFNAEAVKANFDAIQENKVQHSLFGLSSRIASYEAVDDDTFKLVLSEPYYPVLTELGVTRPYRMMSPKSFIDGKTINGVSYYAGTGAYKLDKSVRDQYAQFSANEDYWGGAPAIKKVTLKIMPEGETTLLAFQNGEVNFLFGTYWTNLIDDESLLALKADSRFQVQFSQPMTTRFLLANSMPERNISDKNIKQAVWYAIDRQDLCDSVFSGLEDPAQTIFAKTMPYSNVDLPTREYDVDKAKSLIEASGWTMDNSTGYYTKNGKTLSLEFVYNSSASTNKTIGEFIQADLKKAGIKLDLSPVESMAIKQVRAAGQYDLYLDSSAGVPYDPVTTLTFLVGPTAYLNTIANLDSYKELDDKINSVLASTDETQRQADYTSIMNILQDECPLIPLSYSKASIATSAKLKGVGFSQTQYEVPFKDFY